MATLVVSTTQPWFRALCDFGSCTDLELGSLGDSDTPRSDTSDRDVSDRGVSDDVRIGGNAGDATFRKGISGWLL